MKENHVVENVLATIGAVLWCLQVFPQLWESYRTKSTQGVSPLLMLIWAGSALFFVIYAVTRRLSIPMQLQPHFSGISFCTSWAQCLYYSTGYTLRKSLLCLAGLSFLGCFEAGSVQLLWGGAQACEVFGTNISTKVYGYLALAFSVLGLLPQYYEVYLLREFRGLSWTFVLTDVAGAVFLMASLFFRASLDVSALVVYVVTIAMVSVLAVFAVILKSIASRKRLTASPTATFDSASSHGIEEKSDTQASTPAVAGHQTSASLV